MVPRTDAALHHARCATRVMVAGVVQPMVAVSLPAKTGRNPIARNVPRGYANRVERKFSPASDRDAWLNGRSRTQGNRRSRWVTDFHALISDARVSLLVNGMDAVLAEFILGRGFLKLQTGSERSGSNESVVEVQF
jgi:hypothetical protein